MDKEEKAANKKEDDKVTIPLVSKKEIKRKGNLLVIFFCKKIRF